VPETPALADLARAAAELPLESVPDSVRGHALRVLADTLGVIMAGARKPEIDRLLAGDGALFQPLGGGPCQVLRPGLPGADPVTAAFVNGTAGTFLELDEGCRPTGHPAVHVVPAALAAAQALHRSGSELLAAVLSGYEVTARLFEAYRLTYPLHPHGHFGAVGAAVAVARLRRADAAEPALIAATLPLLPVWNSCYEGATARNAYAGVASAIGVTANRMAAAGFTGSRQAQEVAFGELVGRLQNPAALSPEIDPVRPRILNDYLKLHSACALSHAALDAVLELAPEASQVQRVEVETVANNMKLDRQASPNELSTRFSLPYAVAAAIVHGHTRPDAFIPDRAVSALAERVTIRQAGDLEAGWPDRAPARVTVHTSAGARTAEVQNPRGHHANPATPGELRRKFEMLCWTSDPAATYERLLGLERVADCAELYQ
jgi:2-methylcitrate dehydratase PrpD